MLIHPVRACMPPSLSPCPCLVGSGALIPPPLPPPILVQAIPCVTSLAVHNAPTPLGQAHLLPMVAAALPKLRALALSSSNTQFEAAVHLPALGDASALTSLTRLTLRQATMQDPSLQDWLHQLSPLSAPPALLVRSPPSLLQLQRLALLHLVCYRTLYG